MSFRASTLTSASLPPSASPSSAASTSSVPNPAACLTALFRFVSSVGVLSVNAGHCPYQLTVTPHQLTVQVQLRTVPLHGLSYADFQLAAHIDGLERTSRRQWQQSSSSSSSSGSGSDTRHSSQPLGANGD